MHRVTQEIKVEGGQELRSPSCKHKGSTLLRQFLFTHFALYGDCYSLSNLLWRAWDLYTKELTPSPLGVCGLMGSQGP